VIKGDPSQKIEDIENVETVFKDGVGYDSAKLIESVRGVVGADSTESRVRVPSVEILCRRKVLKFTRYSQLGTRYSSSARIQIA